MDVFQEYIIYQKKKTNKTDDGLELTQRPFFANFYSMVVTYCGQRT